MLFFHGFGITAHVFFSPALTAGGLLAHGGGLDRASWQYVRLTLPYFVLGTAVALIHARALNALLLGEETAANLGVEVERTKNWLLVGHPCLRLRLWL